MIYPILTAWEPTAALNDLLFPGNGLSITGALLVFVLAGALAGFWAGKRDAVRRPDIGSAPREAAGGCASGPCSVRRSAS